MRVGAGVRLLDDKGQERVSYCIHPVEDVPAADKALAQKLLLETDEAAFLATANATQL